VQNGDTVVLGGLIRDKRNGGTNGIPFLKDLPLIGPLFGVTSKNLERTELIVLITPHVIEHRQDAREVTRELQRRLTSVFEEKFPIPDMTLERGELLDIGEGL
jgi:general secretion pathway protein D